MTSAKVDETSFAATVEVHLPLRTTLTRTNRLHDRMLIIVILILIMIIIIIIIIIIINKRFIQRQYPLKALYNTSENLN